MKGFKVAYNNEETAYRKSADNEILIFNLRSLNNKAYSSVSEVLTLKVFHYDFLQENDVISIKIDMVLDKKHSNIPYEDYITFLQKIEHQFLYNILNSETENDRTPKQNSKLGFSIKLNTKSFDIPLAGHEEISLSIIVRNNEVMLGLAALSKNDGIFKRKIWLDKEPLLAGDQLQIEYKTIVKETPFVLEEISLQYSNHNTNIKQYQRISDSLIAKGITPTP